MGQWGAANSSPVWEERSCIGVVSHIPTLCELRDVVIGQTHVIALQRGEGRSAHGQSEEMRKALVE